MEETLTPLRRALETPMSAEMSAGRVSGCDPRQKP